MNSIQQLISDKVFDKYIYPKMCSVEQEQEQLLFCSCCGLYVASSNTMLMGSEAINNLYQYKNEMTAKYADYLPKEITKQINVKMETIHDAFSKAINLTPFNELTDLQVAALLDEDMESYIKIAKIQAGMKLSFDPFLKKQPEGLANIEKIYYKIAGVDIVCRDNDFAQQLVTLLREYKDRICETDYFFVNGTYKHLDKGLDSNFEISELIVYGKDDTGKAKTYFDKLRYYEKDLSDYKEELTKYKKEEAAILEPMLQRRQTTLDSARKARYIAKVFREEYLPLAKGDYELALNFLKKAYAVNEFVLAAIKPIDDTPTAPSM